MNKLKTSVFALMAATMLLASCKNNKTDEGVSTEVVNIPSTASGESNGSLPVFSVETESHGFGKITQGEKVSYAFKFKNTGSADLVISSAQGSCGCTVPSYPRKPIPAGSEGVIDVVFNSEGKSGKVTKTVTVVTNAEPNTKVLTITSEIIVPEDK